MISRIATTTAEPASAPLATGTAGRLGRGVVARVFGSVEALVGGWTLLLYGATFLVVRAYYANHLPHYDSIGSYGRIFELLNLLHQAGLKPALQTLIVNSTTWLQPAFALLFAWAPIRGPEWLVGLNFILLLLAQAAILTYGRTVGFSRARCIVAAVLPVVPGALYAWDGGLQDLRRDPQLVLLLIGCLFLSLAYVLAPSWKRGAALGALFALAQWSRDNAATMMLIVAVPALGLAVAQGRRAGGLGAVLRLGIVPLVIFTAIAGPYYLATLPATIQRFTEDVWGVGEDRIQSLLAFWHLPLGVLLGSVSRLGIARSVGIATAALLAAVLLTVLALWRLQLVQIVPSRLRQRPNVLLLASGAWIIVAVVLYNCLLLGYGARWSPIPFLPLVVGLVAVLAGLSGIVERAPGLSDRAVMAIVGVGCLVVAVSVPARMLLNTGPSGPENPVDGVRAASLEISDLTRGRPVAFLWSAGFGRHHVRYYAAQAGRPPIVEFESIAYSHGDPIDLDQPMRQGDQAKMLQKRLDRTIRRYADFVLVCTQTGFYADRSSVLWPYQVGKPVVDGFLADPGWKPVASFTVVGKPFVLLENQTDRR